MTITTSFPRSGKSRLADWGSTGCDGIWCSAGSARGQRVRQRETARIVADAYGDAGLRFPEPVVIQEFDEYQGGAVLEHGLPRLLETNSELRELHRAFQNSSSSDQRLVSNT